MTSGAGRSDRGGEVCWEGLTGGRKSKTGQGLRATSRVGNKVAEAQGGWVTGVGVRTGQDKNQEPTSSPWDVLALTGQEERWMRRPKVKAATGVPMGVRSMLASSPALVSLWEPEVRVLGYSTFSLGLSFPTCPHTS